MQFHVVRTAATYSGTIENVASFSGDGILRALATPHDFADLKHFSESRANDEVRAVFITEPDEAQILGNLRARGRGFEAWGQVEQQGLPRQVGCLGNGLPEKRRHAVYPC